VTRLALITLIVAAVAGAAAFLGGRALHSQPAGPSQAFDVTGATYQANELRLTESAGGFTGVAEAGILPGTPLYSGRVTSVDAESITIEAAGGPTSIGVTGSEKLYRLEAFAGAAAVGDQVIVRFDAAAAAVVAVLIVRD
jgi:hypothetical protein